MNKKRLTAFSHAVLVVLILLALLPAAGPARSESAAGIQKQIAPAKITPDRADPDNGWFCIGLESTRGDGKGFSLVLALEDLYNAEEIMNLDRGDTVAVCGQTFTVDLVVIHGEYDSDGDGETDTGDITVKDPDQVRDLLDQYEIVITEHELIPTAYEIYPREKDFGGYISFIVNDTALWPAMINDCTPWTQVASAEVLLPLPEGFVYQDVSGGEETTGTAEDFLSRLDAGFNPYNTSGRFENGKLVEVIHSDYPEGPEL